MLFDFGGGLSQLTTLRCGSAAMCGHHARKSPSTPAHHQHCLSFCRFLPPLHPCNTASRTSMQIKSAASSNFFVFVKLAPSFAPVPPFVRSRHICPSLCIIQWIWGSGFNPLQHDSDVSTPERLALLLSHGTFAAFTMCGLTIWQPI